MRATTNHFHNIILLSWALGGYAGVAASAEPESASLKDQYCFARHVIDGTGSGADGVHLGDINGDGFPDVASGWEESAELKLYLHPGEAIGARPGNWQAVSISNGPDVIAIEDAAFIDIDGNGELDSVVSATEGENSHPNRRIRLHRTTGKASGHAINKEWQTAAIHIDKPTERFVKVRGAQLDNQFGDDIVALSQDLFGNSNDDKEITSPGGVFLHTAPPLQNVHLPAAWTRQRLADVHKGKSIELVDMDADTDLDILYSGVRNVAWLENPLLDGTGNDWISHWIGTASDLDLCDVNGDGVQDIVATASSKEYPIVARWFDGNSKKPVRGRYWTPHDIRLAEDLPSKFYQPQSFAVKSIACTRLDSVSTANTPASLAITTSGSGFGIFLVIAPQNFAADYTSPWHGVALTDYKWIMKYDNILAADLDSDGDIDLLTTEENEGVFLQGAGVLWYERKPCE